MERTIYVRASRAAVLRAIRRIPQEATSGSTAANAMMTKCGRAALRLIKRDFTIKMRGGTGEAGDRWAPLSPYTIAYRMSNRTRAERRRSTRPSQALNTSQQERWWSLYRQGLVIHKGNKGRAARRAWFILKSEGAETLFDKYKHAQVDILRETGLLLRSLSPYTKVPEQVFRVGRGEVVVGTNRKGAARHHSGDPSKNLPQRRLWPEPNTWPPAWWSHIAEEARDGLVDVAVLVIRGVST